MKEHVGDESAKTNKNLEALATVAATQDSPSVSYADVARTGLGVAAHGSRMATLDYTPPPGRGEPLFCTADTSRVEDGGDKPNAGRVWAAVEKEMRATGGHGSWPAVIICRDEAEHKLVKNIPEKSFGPGTRVLRDELYPVKVDNVKRTEVLNEKCNVRAEAVEARSRENDTTAAKISWLSKKDMPKAYGSMVVFVTKASDARRLISEGSFHVGGESGTTMAFERRPRPQQCYSCQQITRHKSYQCANPQVYRRCAKQPPSEGDEIWHKNEAQTTIDLSLASEEIARTVVRCGIHQADHGSDHRAVETVFDIAAPEMESRPRLLLKKAPWKQINEKVEANLQRMSTGAKQYHDAIRHQEKSRWEEILADSNTWKAAKYLDAGKGASFDQIPQLKRADGSPTEDAAE
ncbi:hypothetical protein CORC01_14289 [Colletotrichum orchidophilum]|uniref:Reverse transcriptase n=1 Tax=Colletotrichum orchidophilum TaxID=1209926 RepID=A0A1G4AN00_9PEZI|nr:uncharacterized protein CORC01_14289 [Colletotrichum orchidophilum]OHE90412.1 hypothetical protein CORC01_14289 [Colletotrichum orchidophilum]